jgi:hypothetical protein
LSSLREAVIIYSKASFEPAFTVRLAVWLWASSISIASLDFLRFTGDKYSPAGSNEMIYVLGHKN